jgi:hypothetical protein
VIVNSKVHQRLVSTFKNSIADKLGSKHSVAPLALNIASRPERLKHLRTTNVIEPPFATVRLRERATKGRRLQAKAPYLPRLFSGPFEVWDHVFLHKLHAPEHFAMVETTQTRPAQKLG